MSRKRSGSQTPPPPSASHSSSLEAPQTPDLSRTVRWAIACLWLVLATIFFYWTGLPNNGNVSRLDYWWLVPFQLMDLVDPEFESRLPHGFFFLFERIGYSLVSAALFIGSAGWGWLLILGSSRLFKADVFAKQESINQVTLANNESLAQTGNLLFFSAALGLATTSTFVLIVGLMGQLSTILLAAWLLVGSAGAFVGLVQPVLRLGKLIWLSITNAWQSRDLWTLLGWVSALLFLWTIWLGGVSPTTDFDVKEYHLGGPKEYFLKGQIEFLPHNVYTSFPFLTEMLSLAAMVLMNDWLAGSYVATLTLAFFGPLTALGLWALCEKWFPQAALLSAWIWITIPWTYRLSTIAYVEEAFSCYLLAAFLAALYGRSSNHPAVSHSVLPEAHPNFWWWMSGLSAGAAFGCKYPALLFVVIPIGLATIIRFPRLSKAASSASENAPARSLSTWWIWPLVFSAGVLVFAGPWLVKNFWQTGNPVYPLLYSVFGGLDWNEALNEKWRRGHAPPHYSPLSFFTDVYDILARSDWQSGLILLGLPLCWILPSTREKNHEQAEDSQNVLLLAILFLAWFYATWWLFTHRIDRFWAPMLPLLCLISAAGLTRFSQSVPNAVRQSLMILLGASAIFNFSINTGPVGNYNSWLTKLPAASDFTARTTCPEIAAINQAIEEGALPKDIRVLMVGEAEIFDARFDLRYNTVFDVCLLEEWCTHPDGQWRTADEIRARLAQAGITHLFVNWREILRYRTSYGYTDIANPKTIEKLQQMQLIGEPIRWPEGIGERNADDLSAADRQLIENWAPQLIQGLGSNQKLITAQLFPVMTEPVSSTPSP
ncbi:hypothetical protein Spb1_11110 [Planctopirus ephydatiae]|uniref:Glycosyltransferase RgtA/B/C/D-like domain-containing protein n=1 Tax=Planctopirus ephydatiae TaxID=2528019 RepID=A0A518GKQ3_9PLAN|nr:hypothetical protein [Planctopirus ephydatiae]QDV29232.1 hypothetical protein Spb1_11110 [Planctopirus ephydatiae]